MSIKLRVVLWATLFLLSWSSYSKNHLESADSSIKDLINKSQSLLLQGERHKACQILVSSLDKEGVKTKGFVEISKALKKCTEIFISEKAQQIYELAVASYSNDKTHSIEKFTEALGLEPQNGLILKGLIFTLLSQNECPRAKKNFEELKKINPFDEDLESFKFLELVCIKNKSEALSIIVKQDPIFLSQPFWIVNKQRLLLGSASEALQPLEGVTMAKEYPEIIYVYWFYEKKQKEKVVLGEKYKQLCHNPINFDLSYKYKDPWVCSHIKEIEDSLAKGERQ